MRRPKFKSRLKEHDPDPGCIDDWGGRREAMSVIHVIVLQAGSAWRGKEATVKIRNI